MSFSWLFGRSTSPRAPIVVAFLVLLNALMLRVADPPVLARLRDIAFDNFQRMSPRQRPDDIPVRIVDIDEAALGEYGQWPWPRTLLATGETLAQVQDRVLGVGVNSSSLFTEIPGYAAVGVRFGVKTGRHQFTVHGENLTDTNYRGISWGVDAPGRGVSARYAITF